MAGTVERTLALKLIADVGDVSKDLKKVDSRLGRTAKAAASWGKAFAGAVAVAGLEKAVDLIGDAWSGFREGQKVAAQLRVTWKNLGLAARDLGSTLDKVTTSATNLGFSDDEAVQAFNASLKRTKDSEKSYRELQIAMDLVANGAAPDLNSAIRLIEQASKGSARVVDRFGLKSKTAGGRIKELGRQVRGAAKSKAKLDPLGVLFNQMNEDLEGIVGSLATGDIDGAIESVAAAGEHLASAWAKLGGIVPAPLREFADNVAPKVQAAAQAAGDALGSLGSAFSALDPVTRPVLDFLGAWFGSQADVLVRSLQAIADLLKGDFSGAWETVSRVVSNAVLGMIAAWNRLDISVPPFELTWGGGTMLAGTPFAFDIPSGSFRFWSGTGDLFPDIGRDWTRSSGGKGPSGGLTKASRRINNSKAVKSRPGTALPGHKDGLDYVPYDGYVAALHKGERVMTAAENRGSGSTSGGITVVVNGYVGSEAQLARELNRILSSGVQRGMRLGYR